MEPTLFDERATKVLRFQRPAQRQGLGLGGEYTLDNNNPPNEINANLSSGEIYDPLANTWSNIKDFSTTGNSQFGDDPTEMLPGGKVLAGLINGPATYIYDPLANTWTQTNNSKSRLDQSDEESWVTLPDDSILSYDVFGSTASVGHSQRYIPSTGLWQDAGNLPFALSSSAVGSELVPAFLLPNGDAWFTGGNGNTAFYTPATNSWRAGPALPNGDVAADAPVAMLPNGHVLISASPAGTVVGGKYTFPGPTRIYEFDPTVANPTTANSYTNVTPSQAGFNLNQSSYLSCMLVLPNGNVLMCNDSGTIVEFTPTTGEPRMPGGLTSPTSPASRSTSFTSRAISSPVSPKAPPMATTTRWLRTIRSCN